MRETVAATDRPLAGVIGFFDNENTLVDAMTKIRAAGYQGFDAFTPYPVHGLEHAQGLRRSWLPFVTFGGGITGLTLGYLLQWWTSAVSWPLNVGGKPFNSVPAWVPVIFELTILFAGVSTVLALFLVCGLPNVRRKIADPSLTRDRFAIMIESPDSNRIKPECKAFDEKEATSFLSGVGATEVRTVYEEGWF